MNERIVAALLASAGLLVVVGIAQLSSGPIGFIAGGVLLGIWTLFVIRQFPEPAEPES